MRIRPSSLKRRATAKPAKLLLKPRPAAALALLRSVCEQLPRLEGAPIRLRFRHSLWVRRGRLSRPTAGVEVHAASFLRRRQIFLEAALLRHPAELARILTHELFHFVWVRLGNARRRAWEQLIATEQRNGVRGELGYSAQWRREALRPQDRRTRTRRWREYLCESFCDSAAWFFSRKQHEEFTLAAGWRRRRGRWLARLMAQGPLPV